jgi:hypothetical protein
MTGSRQSSRRSDNAAATPLAAPAASPGGKMFAKFERIVKTANAHFD